MKKFSFGLQKVLQLRKFREEEAKIALGQAISFLNSIENQIRETAIKRHHAANERFADTGQMEAWDNYIIRLEQDAQKLTEQAAQAELVVEEKRALYMEVSREKCVPAGYCGTFFDFVNTKYGDTCPNIPEAVLHAFYISHTIY